MFVTFEGMEGSGKSTLSRLLLERLNNANIPSLHTREPGGCLLGNQIRPLLLSTSQVLYSKAELFLFLSDRAQHVHEVIRPALDNGLIVLCDRYADSTIAYQGYGRGMDIDTLQRLNDFSTNGLWPDLTFLLDIEPEKGLARARGRNSTQGLDEAEGRFEAEALEFHTKIRNGFLARAAEYPHRFRILDAELSPEKLIELAWKELGNKGGMSCRVPPIS